MSEEIVRYPGTRYRGDGSVKVVADEEQDAALGPWWFHSPVEAEAAIAVACAEATAPRDNPVTTNAVAVSPEETAAAAMVFYPEPAVPAVKPEAKRRGRKPQAAGV